MTKLDRLAEATAFERLPIKAVFEMMVEREVFQ